jgi:hypothetical protein
MPEEALPVEFGGYMETMNRLTRFFAGLLMAGFAFGLVFVPIGAHAGDSRWVVVPGASDFRDVGGYEAGGGTVKWGVLYRSDDLSPIDQAGVDTLKGLGIRTVVDLRSDAKDAARITDLSGGTIKVVNLPMVADPIKDKNDYYKRMIVNGRGSLISLFVLLSDKKNLPLVIFDRNGRDEAEMATMVVLLVLGVREGDVLSDYLLSNQRGAALKEEWGQIIVRYFDEYGGMDYYTTKVLNLSPDLIKQVRENLTAQ